MDIADLIKLTENRIRYLEYIRQAAWDSGDVTGVANADAQLAKTQQTLELLQSLSE